MNVVLIMTDTMFKIIYAKSVLKDQRQLLLRNFILVFTLAVDMEGDDL